jgi:hypothetical protein
MMFLLVDEGLSAAQRSSEQQQARNANQLQGRVDISANRRPKLLAESGAAFDGSELNVGIQAEVPWAPRRESLAYTAFGSPKMLTPASEIQRKHHDPATLPKTGAQASSQPYEQESRQNTATGLNTQA